jgi:hypothetical protein
MATSLLNSPAGSLISEYGVFWQVWPQFEAAGGERRLVGLEVELIGSHPADLNHVDPSCRICRRVRAVLLGIAESIIEESAPHQKSLMYNIDSHSNSVLCLPVLGNRSAVSVSVNLSWNGAIGQVSETDLLSKIRTLLAKYGIHQR